MKKLLQSLQPLLFGICLVLGASLRPSSTAGWKWLSSSSARSSPCFFSCQIAFLRQFANARGVIIDRVVTDIGSDLNFKRKHWNELIREAEQGHIHAIYIAHKDRFVRFGYDWFKAHLAEHGTELIVLNNEDLSPEKEMIQDLISIIHVFSCRIYGLRKYKNKLKGDEDVAQILQDGAFADRGAKG